LITGISFLIFLGLFFIIGLASVFKSKGTREDYYLAGQSVSPLFSGLSAVATNNSGYMFIGVIGYTYQVGLPSIWLLIGWIVGDFVASLFIHQKLREATKKTEDASFSGVLANWSGSDMHTWQRVTGVLTIIFLGAYAAAQIAAGSKALEGVLGWDRTVGALVVAAMVLSYSVAGGLRASIWTDVAQSLVMLAAMAILVFSGFAALGGFEVVIVAWQAIPGYFELAPQGVVVPGAVGVGLFFVGWFFAGFSVIGQPHIMVRFMALNDAKNIQSARIYYYGFFTVFYLLATLAGMLARLYLPDLNNLDPEMALPTMAVKLLPDVLVGVVLAGIFAATMSTADSLVLSCSSSMTHDFLPNKKASQLTVKLATALVTGLALFIALYASSSVFDLVIMSWSIMAVTFGPMLILLAMHRDVSQRVAMMMIVVGVSVALLWRYLGYHHLVYEGLPAMLLALMVGAAFSRPKQVK
jgi:sodium/proline symporter